MVDSILKSLRLGLVALPLLGSLAGCVLVFPPFEAGEHCGIEGSTSCAKCLTQRCQASIDSCCADSSCNSKYGTSVLDTLDACGRGDQAACAKGFESPSWGSGQTRACITTQCKDDCFAPGSEIAGLWTCSTPRTPKNECATCIYESCTSALDRCCAEGTCDDEGSASINREMGSCISGDEPGCAYVLSQSDSGLDGVVRACIAQNCAGKCVGNRRPHQTCSLQGGGSFCICADSRNSDGTECSVSEVGGICAFAKSGCSCGEYGCDGTSSGLTNCSCSIGGAGSSTECRMQKSDDMCCIRLNNSTITCGCSGLGSCSSYLEEYEISSCDFADVRRFLERNELLTDVCSQ